MAEIKYDMNLVLGGGQSLGIVKNRHSRFVVTEENEK